MIENNYLSVSLSGIHYSRRAEESVWDALLPPHGGLRNNEKEMD